MIAELFEVTRPYLGGNTDDCELPDMIDEETQRTGKVNRIRFLPWRLKMRWDFERGRHRISEGARIVTL